MICVSVAVNDFEECESLMSKHSFIELRLDKSKLSINEIKQVFSMPNKLIAVCRPGRINDNKRKEILITAINAGARFVDIESDSSTDFLEEIKSAAKKSFCKLILSYHNYETTPDENDFKKIIDDSLNKGADIVKIACKSNSEKDNSILLSLYRLYDTGKLIVIGMNEKGKITRIAAPFLGAPFTYASTDWNTETAPGQIDIQSMKKIQDLMK